VRGNRDAAGAGRGTIALVGGLSALSRSVPTVEARADAPAAREPGNYQKDPPKPEDPPKSDKERLSGTWVKVGEEFRGKPVAEEEIRPQWWHFEDDKLTVYGIDLRSSKPEKSEYTFALGAGKNPRTIELTGGAPA
jgi:uncharacterized protein (TIGR03067 family)